MRRLQRFHFDVYLDVLCGGEVELLDWLAVRLLELVTNLAKIKRG